MIRNDSVVDFITYANRSNMNLKTKIKPSIYESNLFLLKNQCTLIEYETFFSSIQIFQYSKMNKAEIKSNIWLYAILSQNPELIHILENNEL